MRTDSSHSDASEGASLVKPCPHPNPPPEYRGREKDPRRYCHAPAAQEEPGLSRRDFVRILGAGLVIAVGGGTAAGQRAGGRRPQREAAVAARLHIGKDGVITVMTGKVEAGQGARAELTQAAAEELRVPVERIELVMADTALVPDDG
ncbi:MAG: nicB, partial [Phycisphaerales bacterium]|nr:nicB [Phycisphaerales bacterium]